MEQKLGVCSQSFDDPTAMLAVHSAQIIAGSKGATSRYPNFPNSKLLNPCSCNPFANRPGFAMVIRRELLSITDNNKRPQNIYSHDHWLWFLAASTGRISIIAESLTFYRQHDRNIFGAPGSHSFAAEAKRSFETIEYDRSAELESACSRILFSAADQNPNYADQLRFCAKRLEFRSELHRLRSRIYNRESALVGRAATFFQIFLLGGYLPDESRTRLGLRAAAKDMLFGVPGTYRIQSTS